MGGGQLECQCIFTLLSLIFILFFSRVDPESTWGGGNNGQKLPKITKISQIPSTLGVYIPRYISSIYTPLCQCIFTLLSLIFILFFSRVDPESTWGGGNNGQKLPKITKISQIPSTLGVYIPRYISSIYAPVYFIFHTHNLVPGIQCRPYLVLTDIFHAASQ